MGSITRRLASVGVSASVLMAAAAAHAQTAPAGAAASDSPAEVIVTAQRRSQNLEKVPLAVSSFSADQLAANQITSSKDIARDVPNMFASNNVGQGSANVYYIRGLGQTQSFPTFEPQVSTYIDDIYIGRQNANNFALFGVDQVQVLRGPQGTLFGRNSTGGAILVTLQKPGETYGGSFMGAYGSYGSLTGALSVDMPINPQILTRFSAYVIHDEGYVDDQVTHETLNANHDYGFREAITILPAKFSNVEWDLSADYSDSNGANVLNQPGSGGEFGSDRVSETGFSMTPGALAPYLTGDKGKLGQGVDVKTWGYSSNFKVKLGEGTLSFIGGFRDLEQALAVDFPDTGLGPQIYDSGSNIGQFALAQELRSEQFTEEVKWDSHIGDKFNYTVGAFALYEKNTDNFGAVGNLAAFYLPPPYLSLPFPLVDELSKNNTTSIAGYAQGDYKITDKLTLTVGGRFTHELKTLNVTPNAPGGFDNADIIAAGYLTRLTTNQFTPHVSLQYQVDSGLMVYGSATRGFQGGGWNGLTTNAATFNNFGPETVWSYEAGFRKETEDHRLRLNGTAFYSDTSHYQLLSDDAAAASFVTNNAANLRAYGAEFDLKWQPTDPFILDFNLGLIEAKYFDAAPAVAAQQAACAAAPGQFNSNCGNGIVNGSGHLAPPTYTPPVTAAVTASYKLGVGAFTLTPSVGVQFTAHEAVGTEGLPPSFDTARTLLDIGLTLRPVDGPWSLTAECKNCTMVDYGTAYLFGYRYYNNPGVWDVRVAFKF
jgi:iron complex outermembrane receptor protein